jgi:hypothetical protein
VMCDRHRRDEPAPRRLRNAGKGGILMAWLRALPTPRT